MEITKEAIGELNEVVSIQLKPEDYKDKVDATIKKTRKGMSVPGFRQGHVPEGMVRKMYGKAILADELNKIVSESLNNFLLENKINILGHPLPVKENANGNGTKNNWENPAEFEFKFELGLAPEFDLTLPPDHVFPYYEIAVDDSKVNEYIEDIRKRYGKHSQPDDSNANSVLYASFTEVGSDNLPVENGIATQTTLAIDLVKDETIKKSLIGLKKDDSVVIDIVKAMNNETEVSHMLKVAKDKVADLKNNFEIKIISINNVENAELNRELYDKVYGVDAVKSEEEFREKLRAEISSMFTVESERKLQHDVQDELLNKFKVSLPDRFLKRWLLDANEKPITEEQVEKEYNAYATGMKWKMIENSIVRENKIQATKEEIDNYSKQLIVNQFAQYGSSYLTDEMIDGMIKRYLSKEENVNHVVESLIERKVFNYLNSIVKKDVKKVSYDEFLKILKEHKH